MLGPLRDQTDTICKAQRRHVFGDFNVSGTQGWTVSQLTKSLLFPRYHQRSNRRLECLRHSVYISAFIRLTPPDLGLKMSQFFWVWNVSLKQVLANHRMWSILNLCKTTMNQQSYLYYKRMWFQDMSGKTAVIKRQSRASAERWEVEPLPMWSSGD